MKRIFLLLTLSLFSVVCIPQGNGVGNGPPTPPQGWCATHPNDPACNANAVQVPLSDWYWEIGLMVVFTTFMYFRYFHKKNEPIFSFSLSIGGSDEDDDDSYMSLEVNIDKPRYKK